MQGGERIGSTQSVVTPKPVPDPLPVQQLTSGWKVIVGLAVGFAIALVEALAGAGVLGDISIV
jgi:hypothetical protein